MPRGITHAGSQPRAIAHGGRAPFSQVLPKLPGNAPSPELTGIAQSLVGASPPRRAPAAVPPPRATHASRGVGISSVSDSRWVHDEYEQDDNRIRYRGQNCCRKEVNGLEVGARRTACGDLVGSWEVSYWVAGCDIASVASGIEYVKRVLIGEAEGTVLCKVTKGRLNRV